MKPKLKLEACHTILDNQTHSLTEANSSVYEVFYGVEKLKEKYDSLENPYARVISAQFIVALQQIEEELDAEKVSKDFENVETKINNLMSFVT